MNDLIKVNEFSLRYTGKEYNGSGDGTAVELISKMLEPEIANMCPYFGMYEVMDVATAFATAWTTNSKVHHKSLMPRILAVAFDELLDGRTLNMILTEMPKLVELYQRLAPRIIGEEAREDFIRGELNSWGVSVSDMDGVVQRIGYLVDDLSPDNVYTTGFQHVVHILLESDTLSNQDRLTIALSGNAITDMVHQIKRVYSRGEG